MIEGTHQNRKGPAAFGGVRVFFAHLLLGPPLGAFFYWLAMVGPIYWVTWTGQAQLPGDVPNPWALLLFMVAFSYIFGGVQAAIAGVWLGIVPAKRRRYGYIEAMAVAAVSGLLIAFAVYTYQAGTNAEHRIELRALGVFLVAPGIPAAFALRALLGWLVPLENSGTRGVD